jgi:O-antigen ligase
MSAIAAVAFIAFVIFLFKQDRKVSTESTPELWIVLAWMFLAGSRWVSSWLNLRPSFASVDAYSEGSPLDRMVFLLLIIAGLVALGRRKINWGELLQRNGLLVAYFLFLLVSITWADQPFVAFKRWFKDLGNPVMALVILTAVHPLRSLTITIRRLSFLLLPLSVLFVRYFPELGRVYHVDGSPMYTGIGHQKNDLGLMCLVTGIYFLWQLLIDKETFATWPRVSRICLYILCVMLAWLLYMSNSQTSLSCLIVAAAVMLAYRMSFVRREPGRLVGLIVSTGLTFAILEASFGIKDRIFELLGRDPSLTNRTELWALLFDIGSNNNAVLGAGFMSFWSGERMMEVWRHLGEGVNQAHSGYIEQYLNLGYVGVGFIAMLMVATLVRIRAHLRLDAPVALLRLCFILTSLLYNYTEASFYGINNMWVLTLVAWIQLPSYTQQPALANAPATVAAPGPKLAKGRLQGLVRIGDRRPNRLP